MTDAAAVARLARLLGDQSRAAMCLAMLDGSAWTLSQLASTVGVTMSTASEHVSTLVDAGILTDERLGRNRYVRLAGQDVGEALEAFSTLTRPAPVRSLRGVGERRRLAAAHTCYDHLAGRLGVVVFDMLAERRLVDRSDGLTITDAGEDWFGGLGVDLDALRSRRRPLVRECIDWTERRPHLAGSLGAALRDRFLEKTWVRRPDRTRRLEVTGMGQQALQELLGIEPDRLRVET